MANHLNPLQMTDEEIMAELNALEKAHPPRQRDPSKMSNEEIMAELRSLGHEPEPEESYLQSAGRRLAMGTKNVAAGLAGGADLLTMPVRAGLNAVSEAMGSDTRFRPAQQIVNEGVDELTGGYTKPRTKTERITSAVTQELAGLPAGFGVGAKIAKHGVGTIKNFGKFMRDMNATNSANVAGTAGAAAGASHYLEGNEDPSMLGVLGSGFLGGMAPGTAVKGLKSTSKLIANPKDFTAKGIGKLSDWDPEAYRKQLDAGVSPSLAASSRGDMAQRAENAAYHIPMGHKVMKRFYQNRADSMKDKLGFEGVGFEDIPSVVNKKSARKAAFNLHDEKSAEQTALRKNIKPLEENLKHQDHMVDVSDLWSDLEKKAVGIHSPKQKKLFKQSVPGAFMEELGDSFPISGKKEIPFATLELLRSKIRNKKDAAEIMSLEKREYGDLYEKLRKAKDSTIEAMAPSEDVAKLRKANKIYSEYLNETIDPRTDKEMGLHGYIKDIKKTKDESEAFGKLMGSDPKYLEVARKGLSAPERKELASSILADMGNSPTGFNLSNVQNKMHGIQRKNKDVMDEYLKLLPSDEARKGFTQVMDFLSHNKKITQAMANSSQTSYMNNWYSLVKEAVKNAGLIVKGATLGSSAAGGFAAIQSGVGGLILMSGGLLAAKKAAQLMTDPVFLARINKVMTAKTPQAQANWYNQLMKTPSVKDMLRDATVRSAKISDSKKRG